jgi:hypothetical protein
MCILINSDSGDEDVSRDESGLDDSFINNGSYTPTPTGLDCGVTMYHRLHRYCIALTIVLYKCMSCVDED